MDTSRYSVGTQSKSVYVHGGATKGIRRGTKGSPHDALTEERAPNVELYTERWEQGLDLWTGEPLEGAALTDWENQQKRRNRLS